MRALLVDVELDLGEVDVVQPDRSRVSGHLAREVDDLLQRSLAGIGRRVKIDRVQLHTPLRDHVSRHRGVDAARQEQHCFAAYADRKAARTGNDVGVDVYFLPDLNVEHDLRIVDVHRQVRTGHEDRLADLLVDAHGIDRVLLVEPSRVYLECRGLVGILFLHKSGRRFAEFLYGLYRHLLDGADAGNAEHAAQRFSDFAVVVLGQALHEDPSVGPVNGKIPLAGLQRVLDLAHQRLLKDVAVLALDADLRVFD